METITTSLNPAVIVAGIFFSFVLLELILGRFFQPAGQRRDALIEIIGSTLLLGVTVPFITFASGAIMGTLTPEWKGALSGIPWLAGFALFLLFDDMTQYW